VSFPEGPIRIELENPAQGTGRGSVEVRDSPEGGTRPLWRLSATHQSGGCLSTEIKRGGPESRPSLARRRRPDLPCYAWRKARRMTWQEAYIGISKAT
jgi:hypothetical protein